MLVTTIQYVIFFCEDNKGKNRGSKKSRAKKINIFLIDILLRSVNPPLFSIDVVTFI